MIKKKCSQKIPTTHSPTSTYLGIFHYYTQLPFPMASYTPILNPVTSTYKVVEKDSDLTSVVSKILLHLSDLP